MVQNGLISSKMVPNGPKWSKIAKNCQNGLKLSRMIQNGQKWSKWSKMVKNGRPDLQRARRTGPSARRARGTKSRGPKGLQLEVRARRAPRLLVIHNFVCSQLPVHIGKVHPRLGFNATHVGAPADRLIIRSIKHWNSVFKDEKTTRCWHYKDEEWR